MTFYEALVGARERESSERISGVVVGVVTNNQDPDKMGRVKVRFPAFSDEDESAWARVAAPMAGNGRGAYFLPEVEDEVLVAFEHGDPRFPYVVGALWNGKDAPPADNSDGKNNVRVIRSRSGHTISLNDENGKEKIEIIDKTGKNSITIDASANTITIVADKDIKLSAPQGKIRLEAQTVEVESTANTKLHAGGNLDAQASGTMNLKGATVNIN